MTSRLLACSFILLSCLSLAPTSATERTIVQEPVIRVTEQTPSGSRHYQLANAPCSIRWQVYPRDRQQSHRSDLGLKLQIDERCTHSFQAMLPTHRSILHRVQSDYPKRNFTALMTGPLYRIEPQGRWNRIIARVAYDHPDWNDWRRHYPNHRSGKSVNQIYVDLANQTQAYHELKQFMATLGWTLELSSCEKVFTKQTERFSFSRSSQGRKISPADRLPYDAGIHYFTLANTPGHRSTVSD